MNYTAFYKGLEELYKDIVSHIQEHAHAIILVNDYLSLCTLFEQVDGIQNEVAKTKELIENMISSADDWDQVKKTFIPTLDAKQQAILEPLLKK